MIVYRTLGKCSRCAVSARNCILWASGLAKSRLDWKEEEEIRLLLQKQVSKASIAKILGVTRPTIHRFIKTRRLRCARNER